MRSFRNRIRVVLIADIFGYKLAMNISRHQIVGLIINTKKNENAAVFRMDLLSVRNAAAFVRICIFG